MKYRVCLKSNGVVILRSGSMSQHIHHDWLAMVVQEVSSRTHGHSAVSNHLESREMLFHKKLYFLCKPYSSTYCNKAEWIATKFHMKVSPFLRQGWLFDNSLWKCRLPLKAFCRADEVRDTCARAPNRHILEYVLLVSHCQRMETFVEVLYWYRRSLFWNWLNQ